MIGNPVEHEIGSSSESCAFCLKQAPLRNSHVLPAFIYRWLRSRSGSGHIRHTEQINRRVQDGLKLPWLCADCEALIGRFETAFATKLFHPWHGGQHVVRYDEWLLKFCVSVSWRVLRYAKGRNAAKIYTPEQERLIGEAGARWRAFLLGEVPHPASFEQHLLFFDTIESTTITDLPRNMNRFMTGAVTLDIVGSDRSLMTFAKLGGFMVFGIIQKGPNRWEGTKIHVKDGVFKPGRMVVPAGLLDLFREKAEYVEAAMSGMSPSQRDKIEAQILANLDSFIDSRQFASIVADAEMFGPDAVLRKDEPQG